MESVGAIVGILDVTLRAGSKIWTLTSNWKDAPAEIHRLKEDLIRAERFLSESREGINVLCAARSRSHQGKVSIESSDELGLLLNDGAHLLRRIEHFVDELSQAPSASGDLSKRRRLMWMMSGRKVGQWRGELNSVLSGICRLLIAQSVSISADMQLSLSQGAEDITSQIEQSIATSSRETVTQLGAILAVSHQAIIAHLDAQLNDKSIVIRERSCDKINGSSQQHQAVRAQPTTLGCAEGCACQCHSATQYRWSLTTLGTLVGSLTLRCQNLSTKRCTSMLCRRDRTRRKIRVDYRLPEWLIRASLTLWYSSSIKGNPEMVLRIVNHLPDSAAHSRGIFGLVAAGDIKGLRELVSSGSVSIHDYVSWVNNCPLSLAASCSNPEVIRYLLWAGADPFQPVGESRQNTVASSVVARFIRGEPGDLAIAADFPISEYLDDFEFSLLHRVLIGATPLSLTDALSMPQCIAAINSCTLNGLTPLHIAAMRDDPTACSLLVNAGAQVDGSHLEGRHTTALHKACLQDNYLAARALISLGASTALCDAEGRCAILHAALAYRRTDTRLLRLILDHGGDIHSETYRGCQPLDYATSRADSKPERLTFLFDHGADLNRPDAKGNTPLLSTIQSYQTIAAAMLLRRGAKPSVVNKKGQNSLHLMAIYADVDEFNDLRDVAHLFRCLDPTARDASGNTPLDSFNDMEIPPPPELRRAFDEFMRSVQGTKTDNDDDDSEELFYDAQEVIEP